MTITQFENDFSTTMKLALKEKTANLVSRLETLKSIKAQLLNKEKEKNQKPSDEDFKTIIAKAIKQRKDAIELYVKGDRLDLAEKEQEQLSIIQEFAPRQLTGDELEYRVEVGHQLMITNELPVNMGSLIKFVKENNQDYQIDGKELSTIVKKYV